MNHFSRSQAATVILLSIFLLNLYGWRHYSHYRQSSKPPQTFSMDVVLQVDGKVRAPGVYSFNQPITVSEAVTRAGGLVPDLKLPPQWEEMRVAHTSHLHIVAESNTVAGVRIGWMAVPSRLVLGEKLNVNQATAAELALVPGISKSLAKRIVARRQVAGGFSRLEDLLSVKGIGPASVKRLRPYLQVSASTPPAVLKPSYSNRPAPVARNLHSHRCSLPNFTFYVYCSSVVPNDALTYREAEPHVASLGGKKRVENEGQIGCLDPPAIVGHAEV